MQVMEVEGKEVVPEVVLEVVVRVAEVRELAG
jgi:hypothetical protein